MGADTDSTSGIYLFSYCYIYHPTNSSKYTFITMQSCGDLELHKL